LDLQQRYSQEAMKSEEELFTLSEKIDALSENISDKNNELQIIDGKIKNLTEQYSSEREVRKSEYQMHFD
jgi:uncharacterized membrane protein